MAAGVLALGHVPHPDGSRRLHCQAGDAAALCRDIYARVFEASEVHLSRVAAKLVGPLPPADPSVMLRFGGLRPLLQGLDH